MVALDFPSMNSQIITHVQISLECSCYTKSLDSTDTRTTGSHTNANVTTFAPACSPGVADNPIFLSGCRILSPADHHNSVIDLSRAVIHIENTALVIHKVVVASGNSN